MANVQELLSQLTLDEKTTLVVGENPWTISGCERLGIPSWTVSDGPIGVRGRGFSPALCLPSASCWAAAFDEGIVSEMGAAIAEEARDRAIEMVLGPTVNIHRHPLGGRHFECYSEDPHLTTRTAVAYIRAVQNAGIGTCIKHYIANDQEYQRHSMSSDVDETTLREVYLPPFEAAVGEAGVRGVMGAYNDVNGVQACESRELLIDILKEEWGFEGFVVSDWGAVKSTASPASNGLDLEMPGPGMWWGGGKLAAAVRSGEVPESQLDEMALRILNFLNWAGILDREGAAPKEASVDRPEARAVARRAATEGIVLLKNEGRILPLDASTNGKIALIGANARETCLLGGGSAVVNPHHKTNIADALIERCGERVTYSPGPQISQDFPNFPSGLTGEVTVEYFEGDATEGVPFRVDEGKGASDFWMGPSWPEGVETFSVRASVDFTPDEAGRWRIGAAAFGHTRLIVDGQEIANSRAYRFSTGLAMWGAVGEVELESGRTYKIEQEVFPGPAGFKIQSRRLGGGVAPDLEKPFSEAVAAASAADLAIVVVGTSAEFECEDQDRYTLSLPGRQDELVAAVAAVNPRTIVVNNSGSPVTMPWAGDVPAILQVWFPGQEGGEAVVDVLLGESEPGGRLPTTWPVRIEDTPAFATYPGKDGHAPYAEGLFVGHRWYDAYKIEPLWPFGHGLSYAEFAWDELDIETRPGENGPFSVTVRVRVTNTSQRPGSEVVQCYVSPPAAPVARPPRELKGYSKLRLAPGESKTAEIELNARSFSRWDRDLHNWVVDPGDYVIEVGRSSRQMISSTGLRLGYGR